MIDASIPLRAVTPLPTVDPLEQYGKAQALKIQQEQLAGAQIQRQEAERAIQEDQKLRELFTQNPNPTDADLIKTVGAKRASDIIKSRMDAQKTALELRDKLMVPVQRVATRLRQLPAEQRAAEWASARPILAATGFFDPAKLTDVPTDQDLDMAIAFSTDPKVLLEMANARAQEERAKAEEERKAAEETRKASLFPTQQRKATADATAAEQAAAGTQPITPYQKAQLDRQAIPNTPAELAIVANDPKQPQERRDAAKSALKELERHAVASRPQISVSTPGASASDPKAIAQAIIEGNQPPSLQGLYRYGAPVRAELARQKFDLTTAQRDWQAIQRHIATLNGPQQERLRQAVTFTYDSLDVIEGLFAEWKKLGKETGIPLLNKANLKIAKNLPGRAGEVAVALEAQINDLTSELGTVYKGGNSSTDESLRLAAENLRANWNSEQFKRQLENIRTNLRIRKNSILNSEPVGVSAGSRYAAPTPGGATPTATPARPRATNPKTNETVEWDGKAWVKVSN